MKKLFLFLISISSTVCFGQRAQAVCNVNITVNNVAYTQAEEDQSVAVNIELTRLNTTGRCKKYKLGLSTGRSGTYDRKMLSFGTDTVKYNFYENESTTQVIKDLGDDNTIDINFQNSTRYNLTIFARMPNPFKTQSVSPGLYYDVVSLNIAPTNNNTQGGGSTNMYVYMFVTSQLQISLVNKGESFDANRTNYAIEFGTMYTGQTKGFHHIVRSNAGYRITVSSENDGRMKHIDRPNNIVDYDFVVDGRAISLTGSVSNPKMIHYSSSGTPSEGTIIDINVVVKNVENKLSGRYRDFIYLNAISN